MKYTILFFFVLCITSFRADSQNLYTQANDANIENEANAVTGWTGPAAITSESGNLQNGIYSLQIAVTNAGCYDRTGFQNFNNTSVATQAWTKHNWILTAPSQGDTQAPTTPAGLAVSNTTVSGTTLTWNTSTDNTGVTQYQIRRDNLLIGSMAENILTCNATGLIMSTTYSFNVVTLDAANNVSLPGNTIQVTTLAGSGEPNTTLNANYRLSVNGDVRAKEVVVETGWSDFVFYDDYYLKPLKEVEQYIIKNGHLQDIPPASEVRKNGVGLAGINRHHRSHYSCNDLNPGKWTME